MCVGGGLVAPPTCVYSHTATHASASVLSFNQLR